MRVENLIPLGMIPGLKAPQSLISFFSPFIDECLELAKGIHTYDARAGQSFKLHAYPITFFGDLPAMSKLLVLKGHNAYAPC
jgi:Transposase family tnp2